MLNKDLLARKNNAVPHGLGVATEIYADRARNAELWDVEGNRYIDFAAGIAVVNTGHCHPKVIAAVTSQLDRFSHTCAQVVQYELYVSLAEKLNRLVPGDFPKKTVFLTTGAEAVENAIKLAKSHTSRSGVLAFSGGFHGRTHLGMALTGKVAPYKSGFGPQMPDVFHAPFPVSLRGQTAQSSIKAIETICQATIAPDRLAAIILEPVQGEGGFYIAPSDFMQALREFCDLHGIVLIADEVQTGLARTGKIFAMEHYGIAADLTTMAKGLGGGFPISGVTGRADIMDSAAPGGLGGTYGGSPIGLAAADAVLHVIQSEGLCDRAENLGRRLEECLNKLAEEFAEIAEVRRLGLMVAIEFADRQSNAPAPEFAARLKSEALSRGLILLSCGTYGNVIRFLPPLTIDEPHFEEAMLILEASLREVLS